MSDEQPGKSEDRFWPLLDTLDRFSLLPARMDIGGTTILLTSRASLDGAVGAAIRRRRRQSGATLAEMADRTGLTPSTLSRMETGKTAIKRRALAAVAQALDAAPLDLMVEAVDAVFDQVYPRPTDPADPTPRVVFGGLPILLLNYLDILMAEDDAAKRQASWQRVRPLVAERLGALDRDEEDES